ncbi:UDP-N-acetylmuramoylalanyl-D-glutamate-2, 6-diaminopimelate ligase [Marinomonas sp. MED121]|uniref:UDP-N-acetylmuramoyl-L-alanyl-D-glutamate--2, 6-diaminopimelate ligase n=1 Tax=Marinomonas sp. MED121 TaxID=314277 RepID=UPI0000690517|nr:UDP-N-acetylmuramoyl-L-alanyl-D-glutamate--2,6-diaminopimelate ligase [Marinomonas sp. MED121]EAQ63378.1 UDP-N-acetylmuramoylalanyl-D-glutamate-2, 6-diaminopimelate ligase [Marinomonas sp. MED121]
MSIFSTPIKSHLVEAFFGLKTGQLSSFDEFEYLATDSRNLSKSTLFFALPGVSSNGWDYLASIAAQGCRVVVVPEVVKLDETLDLAVIRVPDTLMSMTAFITKFALPYPSSICAVTGTNGKSSISYYSAQIAKAINLSSAIVGTFGVGLLDDLKPSEQTTPDLLSMHTLAITFASQGVEHMTFEASSHALDQGRIEGLPIETAIYSNLSRDHLDYHGSMAAYAEAKAKLFRFPQLKRAVICIDDEYSDIMLDAAACPVYSYSLQHENADFFASNLNYLTDRVEFDLKVLGKSYSVSLPLLGEFNVANAIAALAAHWDQVEDKAQLISALSLLSGAPGRMQMVNLQSAPLVVIDYAHTPSAIEVALKALRLHNKGRLTCIYGCGGDRDRGKRPLMTEAALAYSDIACLTSDNPRTESVAQILDDALIMLENKDALVEQGSLHILPDRRAAIFDVIAKAQSDDVILIAGKGHENYQDIDGVKHHFDDAEVALEALTLCWSN